MLRKASEPAAHVAGFGLYLEGFGPPSLPQGVFCGEEQRLSVARCLLRGGRISERDTFDARMRADGCFRSPDTVAAVEKTENTAKLVQIDEYFRLGMAKRLPCAGNWCIINWLLENIHHKRSK
ncbi:MAG TPA: hypothetical protein IAA66_03300 [Candidatus Avichristensenella intestinipullorum]|uniref:Uncharacterized protein n=1 Tax=Candidatus Avichristensenella intestinipullorum TaxID=2840693 RepID=A0A9D1CIQ9_9FIRM|nr:hypothetical protein [Candidatus Avichristensenella intestinipullorum]